MLLVVLVFCKQQNELLKPMFNLKHLYHMLNTSISHNSNTNQSNMVGCSNYIGTLAVDPLNYESGPPSFVSFQPTDAQLSSSENHFWIFAVWQRTFSCLKSPRPLENAIAMKGCSCSATMFRQVVGLKGTSIWMPGPRNIAQSIRQPLLACSLPMAQTLQMTESKWRYQII